MTDQEILKLISWQEQIDLDLEKISKMPHEAMGSLMRFAPVGHRYFVKDSELYKAFLQRFNDFGGWTPGLSKQIGRFTMTIEANETDEGWVGFDLDGTLAHYDGWRGVGHIGKPIKPMVELLRTYLAAGKNVKIFTARVAHDGSDAGKENAAVARFAIYQWMEDHIGTILPITCSKDHLLLYFYDDRVRRVELNTGKLLD